MPVVDIPTLKSYFTLTNVPTPSQYIDLIDTLLVGGEGEVHNHDTRYVRLLVDQLILATHTFNPDSSGPPFLMGPNAVHQKVTGLYSQYAEDSINADNLNRSVTAGDGLTGGGSLSGQSISISLTTPGTLSVSSSDSSVGNHTHEIVTRSQPGEDDFILATDVNGALHIMSLYADDSFNANYITDLNGASALSITPTLNLVLNPGGDITLDPTGDDVLPLTNYDINLGSLSKKYLTIHAAELWVETLVAADVIATIGGHILVAPTTTLVEDTQSQTQLCLNNGFEIAGGGGVDVFLNWVESAGNGTIIRDSTYKHGGTYSCKLTSGISFNTYVYQQFDVNQGEVYTISFWVRTISASSTYQGRYGIYDATHSTWIVALTGVGGGTIFTETTLTCTIPAGCTRIYLYFYCPTGNTYYAHFDDVICYLDYINTKHNNLVTDDIVYMQSSGKIEFIRILSEASIFGKGFKYYVQRDLDGTGPNNWYAGDAVLNTGNIGDGYIDIYSEHSIKGDTEFGPTVAGIIRIGTVYNNLIEGWAIGNLNGLYGYGEDTYGAAFGRYQVGYDYITIEPTNGIQMKSNRVIIGEKTHVKLNLQGDFFLGTDISIASGTNFAVFNVAQTYNTESIGAGDLLLGDNSASKANLLWDKSAGTLNFRVGTTSNMIFNTDGSIRIGPVGGAYQYLSSTLWAFRRSDDVNVMSIDPATSIIHMGIPEAMHVSNSGLRLKSLSPTFAKIIFDDDLEETDEGLLSIRAQAMNSGEWESWIGMQVPAGSYQTMHLGTASPGGTGIPTRIDFSSYSTLASCKISFLMNSVEKASITSTSINFTDDVRISTGLAVGANVDPDTKTIMIAETTAPAGTAAYGKFFCHSSYNAAPFCEDDLGNDIPMGIFHNMLGPYDGYYGAAVITNVNNTFALTCGPTSSTTIDYIFSLPRGWAGKTITAYIYWCPSDTGAGNVVWTVEGRRIAGGVVVPSGATVNNGLVSAAPGVQYQIVTGSTTISLSSFSEGDSICFRIYRNGGHTSDTYASNCYFYAVKVSVVG